jgi:hypothetical protein
MEFIKRQFVGDIDIQHTAKGYADNKAEDIYGTVCFVSQ